MKTRDEIAGEEMTPNPIFLLQVRHGKQDKWKIDTVFFTRGEAETWAKAHEYRWKEWQVWCGYATGELCDVLRMPEAIEAQTRPLTLDECRVILNENKYSYAEPGWWSEKHSWLVDGHRLANGYTTLTLFEATCLARGFLAQGGAA